MGCKRLACFLGTGLLAGLLAWSGYPATPVAAQGATPTPAITCGVQSCYALKSDGTVWAWGDNSWGQLGDGNTLDSTAAVQVAGLTGVVAVAAGDSTGYALKADGTVWAWGFNSRGQVGDGTDQNGTVPVQVYGLTEVTAIADGAYSGYALRQDGTVWSWGADEAGQLGTGLTWYGMTADANLASQVVNLSTVTSIGAEDDFAYAIERDGTVWTWGAASYARRYGAITPVDFPVPSPVDQGNFRAVSAVYFSYDQGSALAFFALQDGSLWSWGSDGNSQLGDGLNINEANPVPVQSHATAVAGNFLSGYALWQGSVDDWGDNSYGQLGNGAGHYAANSLTSPVNLSNVTEIAASGNNAYALEANGSVWGWGASSPPRSLPAQIGNLVGIADITCPVLSLDCYAITSDGSVWAWGPDNRFGQLGIQAGKDPDDSLGMVAAQVLGLNLLAAGNAPAPVGQVVLTLGVASEQAGSGTQTLPVAPLLEDGTVYVPMQFAGQTLGANVSWDAAAGAVTVSQNARTVVMTLEQTVYTVNGRMNTMDAEPFLTNSGFTMLPLRAVSQALGYRVTWNSANKQVTITPGP